MGGNGNMSLILISSAMLIAEYFIFFEQYTLEFKTQLRKIFIFYNTIMISILFVSIFGLGKYLATVGVCLSLFLILVIVDIKKGAQTYEEDENIQN